MYFRIKTKVEDSLYSQIIRHGVTKCLRCKQVRDLQCCHIFSRRHKAGRWLLKPYRNAIPLCFACHDWFDTHKMDGLIWDKSKRVFDATEESYTFLVSYAGFTWEDLQSLYALVHRTVKNKGKIEQAEIRNQLKTHLERLNEKVHSTHV